MKFYGNTLRVYASKQSLQLRNIDMIDQMFCEPRAVEFAQDNERRR